MTKQLNKCVAATTAAYSSSHGGANGDGGNTFYSATTGVYSSTYPPVSLPTDPSLSVVPHLFAARPDDGRRPCLVDAATGHAVSRADLRRLVASLAAGLRRRHGLRKGDVALLLLPNSLAFPVAFLAVLAAGAVATTMNPASAAAEIAGRVRATRPAVVLAAPGLGIKLPPLRVPIVLVPEDLRAAAGGGNQSAPELAHFHELLAGGEAVAPAPAVGQDDAAAILFSSGTGGRSKGAVLTHRNLIATAELFVRPETETSRRRLAGAGDDGGGGVYLAALPMFHIYGLALFAMGLPLLGSTVVVIRRFDAGEALKAIRRHGVTHLPLVPPMMAALVRAAKAAAAGSPAELGFESLVQVSSGAAPVSRKLINDFLEAFPHVDFIQGYAMTESAGVGTRGFNTSEQKKYTSVGLLAPNMHARIVDPETGCPMPPYSCGELWLHGPAIMQGYLNNENASTTKDGWLRTGDIGYFDEDGYLYIVDRLKDTIKYKGFQIAPADLEEVLIEHPEIVDVAVASAEDEEAGEIPVAFVVKRPGSTLSCVEVMDYVSKQVASYKKIRKVIFVESVPKSPAGKVLRRLLKKTLTNVDPNTISKL
ncbi:unnamed protein product [Urochloa humidicola]